MQLAITNQDLLETKNSFREFFVGVASYLKENKISSLVLVFVHSLTLIVAPVMLGQALGRPVSQ